MAKPIKTARKAAIFITGMTVVVLGIILIPLPGPGLLVVIAGLSILSIEFEWAKKYLDRAKKELRQIYEKAKARQEQNRKK